MIVYVCGGMVVVGGLVGGKVYLSVMLLVVLVGVHVYTVHSFSKETTVQMISPSSFSTSYRCWPCKLWSCMNGQFVNQGVTLQGLLVVQ